MPAAIPLAAAAVGVGASAIAGASGVGKNPYRAVNFQDTNKYDPNRFNYGGQPGGANAAAGRYQGWADSAQSRLGAQADYSQSNWDRVAAGQARQGQADLANMMSARAQGLVPSIAGQQSAADIAALQRGAQMQGQQAFAQQAAQQASARGPAGLALAGQNAANNVANAQSAIGTQSAMATQNISNQAQVNAAMERMQAEQNAFGAFSGIRGGDQTSGQMAAQQAQYNAGLQQQQRQLNDAMTLGMTGYEAQVRAQQLQADTMQQQMLSGSHQSATGQNMGANAANAQREMQFFQAGLGAVEGAAQMGMQGGGGAGPKSDDRAKYGMIPMRADGGPVAPGQPYLVGERGPEVVVPAQHGLVIPNEQVRDFGEVEDWGLAPPPSPRVELGQDEAYRHRTMQVEMDRELGLMQLARRGVMSETKKDSRADQRRVKDAYYAELARQADDLRTSMRQNLGRGAAVARYEGEVDQPTGEPAWLADYMAQQDPRVAQGPLSDDKAKREMYELGLAHGSTRASHPDVAEGRGYTRLGLEKAAAPKPPPPSALDRAVDYVAGPDTIYSKGIGDYQAKAPLHPRLREAVGLPLEVDRLTGLPKNLHRDINNKTDEVTSQLAHGLSPIEFEYKPGMGPPGRRPGVRAQVAEQFPITSSAVTRGADGLRRIDPAQGLSTALAGVGHLARKTSEMEDRIRSYLGRSK